MSEKPLVVSEQQCPEHLRANRGSFAQWFGRTVLRIFGWRVDGQIPNLKRLLIIGAPHTSNWDFVYAMAAILGLNIRLRWLGKHTIFKPGVLWFMEWLGGIPINRSKPQDIVDNVARLVERENGIVIGLAPEGTRKKVDKWKTGFLRMAEATDCTIFMIGLDFARKRVVLGESFEPTGDHEADLAAIMEHYKRYNGKYPERE
jgi:1-acyl-sn-glycerol-3-phosphate acyltransferase